MEIKAIIQVIIKCTIYLEDLHLVSNRRSSHEKVHLDCRHLDAALRPSVRLLSANLTQDSCLHFSFHFAQCFLLSVKKKQPQTQRFYYEGHLPAGSKDFGQTSWLLLLPTSAVCQTADIVFSRELYSVPDSQGWYF